MARWWCRTAARICAGPAPRICCNGATRSGNSSGRRGRRASESAARGARVRVPNVAVARNRLSKKIFPGYPHRPRGKRVSGHLPVTMMMEPDLIMSVRRMLTALAASVLVCGAAIPAQAQGVPSKSAAKPAAAKPEVKPEAKPAVAKPEAKPAAAVTGNVEPTLIGQFGTWGAYTAMPNGKKVCFALAKPSSSKTNPPNRPRDPAYVFISSRPAEKVVNEVSVMIGYQLKPGSDSALEIGSARYAMYTQGDGLWIKNAAEEDRMVEALRKGTDVTVKGVSAKGTESTDTFSLKGLAQA